MSIDINVTFDPIPDLPAEAYMALRGLKGDKGDNGDKGDTGASGSDGYSPTATVTKSGSTTTITITDKNGTTTASVNDGQIYTAGTGISISNGVISLALSQAEGSNY